MNKLPSRDDFLKHLNEKFRVYFDGQTPTEVELTEVSENRPRNNYIAFALVFIAPKSIPPWQTVARVEHAALGEFELFLMPFAETEQGFAFEAHFNQPVSAVSG
jgi:hypothetical protein